MKAASGLAAGSAGGVAATARRAQAVTLGSPWPGSIQPTHHVQGGSASEIRVTRADFVIQQPATLARAEDATRPGARAALRQAHDEPTSVSTPASEPQLAESQSAALLMRAEQIKRQLRVQARHLQDEQEPVDAIAEGSTPEPSGQAAAQAESFPADHAGPRDAWYAPLLEPSAAQEARRERIRQCIEFYYTRLLSTADDSPWSMMHHVLAWGPDAQVWVGKPGGKRVSAVGWLCANGLSANVRLLRVEGDRMVPRDGPGLQGHEGQFLALLAQARIRRDQPIRVDGKMFTVEDLIRHEQRSCRSATELTFRLIGLVHYLDTDTKWQSSDGQDWSFARLLQEEIQQPINGVTCGGTHRLMGMSYAVRRRYQEDRPVTGQWKRAEKYTADYREYAFKTRNGDGSFSSDFFRSRGSWGDIDRKLKTTGHIMEWLVFATPHGELHDPRLLQSLDYLTTLLTNNRYYGWDKGALAHAMRAILLYDERVFGGRPGQRNLEVADQPPPVKNRERSAAQPAPVNAPHWVSPTGRRGRR